MFYLEDMVVKKNEIYSIYLHFTLMTPIYTILPLYLTYNTYNR